METIKTIAANVAFWTFMVICFTYVVRLCLSIPKIKKLIADPATRHLVPKHGIAMQVIEAVVFIIGMAVSISSFLN